MKGVEGPRWGQAVGLFLTLMLVPVGFLVPNVLLSASWRLWP